MTGFELCEFEAEEGCECCGDIPDDKKMYFRSDGGYEPRDGTYYCGTCVVSAYDALTKELESEMYGDG